MKCRFLISLCVCMAAGCLPAQSAPGIGIEGFRQIYLTSGFPVDGTPIDKHSADVKFQISFAVSVCRNLGGIEGLDLKVGYTQKSVWFLYAPSSPFKDNTYIPGFYIDVPLKVKGGSLLCGIEHRSNGRGDNLSRSINYVFGEYAHSFPFGLTLCANARAGIGWYDEAFTQDIFSKFYGYVTFGALYEVGRFSALVSATPVFGPFRLNHTVELACRPFKSQLWNVFIQYHHGFDECLSDCVYGNVPGYCIRFGILITAPGVRKLSR